MTEDSATEDWYVIYEALGQYVENQRDHVADLDADEDAPAARGRLKCAERLLAEMDAKLAAEGECPLTDKARKS